MAEALIIVDFQNDFTPGGALAVPEGDAIGDRVRELAGSGRFDLVVATRDWHPADHGSFDTSEPPGPWPPHCVAGTLGAELDDALPRERVDVIVDKGADPAAGGSSGLGGPGAAGGGGVAGGGGRGPGRAAGGARRRPRDDRRAGHRLLRARHRARRAARG